MRNIFLTASVLAGILPLFVSGAEYPAPPQEGDYVLDQDGVISSSYEDAIDDLCEEVEAATSVRMYVVILSTLPDEDILAYSRGLYSAWNQGVETNGLVLVVSVDDHKVTTYVGDRLASALTEREVDRTRKQILIPNFRSKEYGRGIYWAFREYAKEIEKAYDVKFDAVREYPRESQARIPDWVVGECCASCFRGACTAFWTAFWWDVFHHRHHRHYHHW